MNKLSKILLLTACAFLVACSSDDREVFDELLSGTTWYQNYVTPDDVIISEEFSIPDYILDRLQSEMLAPEQSTDTINSNITRENEYLLMFGYDNTCQLNDIHTMSGTCRLETYEVTRTYYPNQTCREDFGDGITGEIVVCNDSITIRTLYGDEIIRQDKMFLGKNNIVRKRGETLDVSVKVFDTAEEVETITMTYKRDGSLIELSGEKNLNGIISNDVAEIELDEIGTLYRQ